MANASKTTTEGELATVRQQLTTANANLQTAQDDLKEANDDLKNAQDDLKEAQGDLQTANDEFATVKKERDDAVRDLARAEVTLEGLRAWRAPSSPKPSEMQPTRNSGGGKLNERPTGGSSKPSGRATSMPASRDTWLPLTKVAPNAPP